jgi:hypothetical protein
MAGRAHCQTPNLAASAEFQTGTQAIQEKLDAQKSARMMKRSRIALNDDRIPAGGLVQNCLNPSSFSNSAARVTK